MRTCCSTPAHEMLIHEKCYSKFRERMYNQDKGNKRSGFPAHKLRVNQTPCPFDGCKQKLEKADEENVVPQSKDITGGKGQKVGKDTAADEACPMCTHPLVNDCRVGCCDNPAHRRTCHEKCFLKHKEREYKTGTCKYPFDRMKDHQVSCLTPGCFAKLAEVSEIFITPVQLAAKSSSKERKAAGIAQRTKKKREKGGAGDTRAAILSGRGDAGGMAELDDSNRCVNEKFDGTRCPRPVVPAAEDGLCTRCHATKQRILDLMAQRTTGAAAGGSAGAGAEAGGAAAPKVKKKKLRKKKDELSMLFAAAPSVGAIKVKKAVAKVPTKAEEEKARAAAAAASAAAADAEAEAAELEEDSEGASSIDDDDICSICLDARANFTANCGGKHRFCLDCIVGWCKQTITKDQKQTDCPYCRLPISNVPKLKASKASAWGGAALPKPAAAQKTGGGASLTDIIQQEATAHAEAEKKADAEAAARRQAGAAGVWGGMGGGAVSSSSAGMMAAVASSMHAASTVEGAGGDDENDDDDVWDGAPWEESLMRSNKLQIVGFCPEDRVPKIIGKRGATIEALRQATGTSIYVDSDMGYGGGEPQSSVKVVGLEAGAHLAVRIIKGIASGSLVWREGMGIPEHMDSLHGRMIAQDAAALRGEYKPPALQGGGGGLKPAATAERATAPVPSAATAVAARAVVEAKWKNPAPWPTPSRTQRAPDPPALQSSSSLTREEAYNYRKPDSWSADHGWTEKAYDGMRLQMAGEIAADRVGIVLGKAGATKTEIRLLTNTDIIVFPSDSKTKPAKLLVKGLEAGVHMACRIIVGITEENLFWGHGKQVPTGLEDLHHRMLRQEREAECPSEGLAVIGASSSSGAGAGAGAAPPAPAPASAAAASAASAATTAAESSLSAAAERAERAKSRAANLRAEVQRRAGKGYPTAAAPTPAMGWGAPAPAVSAGAERAASPHSPAQPRVIPNPTAPWAGATKAPPAQTTDMFAATMERDRQMLEKRPQDAAAKEQAPRGGLLGWSAAPAARSTSSKSLKEMIAEEEKHKKQSEEEVAAKRAAQAEKMAAMFAAPGASEASTGWGGDVGAGGSAGASTDVSGDGDLIDLAGAWRAHGEKYHHSGPPPFAFMFVCNADTLDDCIDRSLFGAGAREWINVATIGPSTMLFLFDYSTHGVHGVFRPAAPPGMDLDRDAWKGSISSYHCGSRFPAQVRTVKVDGEYPARPPLYMKMTTGPLSESEVKQLVRGPLPKLKSGFDLPPPSQPPRLATPSKIAPWANQGGSGPSPSDMTFPTDLLGTSKPPRADTGSATSLSSPSRATAGPPPGLGGAQPATPRTPPGLGLNGPPPGMGMAPAALEPAFDLQGLLAPKAFGQQMPQKPLPSPSPPTCVVCGSASGLHAQSKKLCVQCFEEEAAATRKVAAAEAAKQVEAERAREERIKAEALAAAAREAEALEALARHKEMLCLQQEQRDAEMARRLAWNEKQRVEQQQQAAVQQRAQDAARQQAEAAVQWRAREQQEQQQQQMQMQMQQMQQMEEERQRQQQEQARLQEQLRQQQLVEDRRQREVREVQQQRDLAAQQAAARQTAQRQSAVTWGQRAPAAMSTPARGWGSAGGAAAAPSSGIVEQKWTCQMCTLVNDPMVLQCAACLSEKPATLAAAAPPRRAVPAPPPVPVPVPAAPRRTAAPAPAPARPKPTAATGWETVPKKGPPKKRSGKR